MINMYNGQRLCAAYYLIGSDLETALIKGRMPNNLVSKKSVSLDKPGVYLVAFGVLNNDKPTLIYSYIFYPDLFVDLLLMYLIIRTRFRDSIIYNRWGTFYTFIDESLGYGKEGLIKLLMDSPNSFNEYLNLDSHDKDEDSDFFYNSKKYIYINNIYKMCYLLDLVYRLDNISFIQSLYKEHIPEDKLWSNSKIYTNLLDNCLFVVRDLNKFINIIKKGGINVNQGSQKWRGQINSLYSFIACLDEDFRDSLYHYNLHHASSGSKSDVLKLSKDNFSFKNIHINLGNSKW